MAALSRAAREVSPPVEAPPIIARLMAVLGERGEVGDVERLARRAQLAAVDLADVEAQLAALPRHGSRAAEASAHLLDLGGKRLRPLCVALAARLGGVGFGAPARELAVAVELVHAATLLHDDVVDDGELRRGAPTARLIWGNATSIFAGDWLLIEALRRVERAAVPDALGALFDTIGEMIVAETLQLAGRGRMRAERQRYLDIVDGKTAALFAWALFAGARAGGLEPGRATGLARFGRHLGIAFQLVDDLLDYCGSHLVGKRLHQDLAEGRVTFPLIVGIERDAGLQKLAEAVLAQPQRGELREELLARLHAADAFGATRRLAAEHVAAAAVELVAVGGDADGQAALGAVARLAVERDQ